MFDSLELYNEAVLFAKCHPPKNYPYPTLADTGSKNYYLQLITTIFYELTTKKTSPLISLFCQMNIPNFVPKNFKIMPQLPFNNPTSFDMYVTVYGLSAALSENLNESLNVYESCKMFIFLNNPLKDEYFPHLIEELLHADAELGKFSAAEKVVEVPAQQSPQKIFDAQEFDFVQNLNALAENRNADDEKIIGEIKKVQLALQEELPRLQSALKNISEIRDGIEFQTLKEPINQLLQLYDKLHETLQRHPQSDMQKGYANLIKRCGNFSRYVEQSLAMLGAKLINEINIPFDPAKHTATNISRPSNAATVSKVLSVGIIFKGQLLRKAEVEIAEPPTQTSGTSLKGFFAGQKFSGR